MLTTACPVMGDLARHLNRQDRDERLLLAIENEADLMLDDEQHRAGMAEAFVVSLYEGTEEVFLAEFHALVGKQILRAAFDRDPGMGALYPNLASAAREWIDGAAEAQLKKEAA